MESYLILKEWTYFVNHSMKYFYFDCDVLFSILRGIRKKKFFKPYFRSLKNARKKCTGYLKDYYVEKRIARFEKKNLFSTKILFRIQKNHFKNFPPRNGAVIQNELDKNFGTNC
jgi:hypothetical protein